MSKDSKAPVVGPDGQDVGISPGNNRAPTSNRTTGPDGVNHGDGISWSRGSRSNEIDNRSSGSDDRSGGWDSWEVHSSDNWP